jgi:acyl-CoA thioesterase-1
MLNKAHILIAVLGVAVIALIFLLVRKDTNERIIDNLPDRVTEGGVTIIAFGDSLTAGYDLPAFEAYPAQLEAALRAQGYAARVINAGVSGETTRGNLERARFIRSQNPDIVLLGIGGNDALRLLPIEETKKNIGETIDILQSGANPPVVVLLQMQAPLNAGLGYKRSFDEMYTALAKEKGTLLTPFLTLELFLQPENKLPDGIHLNATGNKLVVDEYLIPVLVPLLEQISE